MVLAAPGPLLTPPPSSSPPKTLHIPLFSAHGPKCTKTMVSPGFIRTFLQMTCTAETPQMAAPRPEHAHASARPAAATPTPRPPHPRQQDGWADRRPVFEQAWRTGGDILFLHCGQKVGSLKYLTNRQPGPVPV
jgi:hypothetical protein